MPVLVRGRVGPTTILLTVTGRERGTLVGIQSHVTSADVGLFPSGTFLSAMTRCAGRGAAQSVAAVRIFSLSRGCRVA